MNRDEFLDKVKQTLNERGKQYGKASGPENSFVAMADSWSYVIGVRVTPAQVLLCMMQLKMTRLMSDNNHEDSLLDLVGYAALLREHLDSTS